jgi:hypothetical protein
MKTENWIELLVGVIILGALAFLAVKVVDISGTLGGVDARSSSTAERVSRIAAALPDVGVRVANEEMSRPFQTVVLSTTPSEGADGTWHVTVTVLDTQSSKIWTLPIKLASKDDRQVVHSLVGTGSELDRAFSSLSLLQEYSRIAHGDSSIPPYVDVKASFVLYNTNGEEFVRKLASTPTTGADAVLTVAAKVEDYASSKAEPASFDTKVEDYATLVKALKQRQEAFKPPEK